VIFTAFKAVDSALRGSNGEFDSHTSPPIFAVQPSRCTRVLEKIRWTMLTPRASALVARFFVFSSLPTPRSTLLRIRTVLQGPVTGSFQVEDGDGGVPVDGALGVAAFVVGVAGGGLYSDHGFSMERTHWGPVGHGREAPYVMLLTYIGVTRRGKNTGGPHPPLYLQGVDSNGVRVLLGQELRNDVILSGLKRLKPAPA
jgi:hypothetical protein